MAHFLNYLGLYLLDKALRFKIVLLFLPVIFASCGPKPQIQYIGPQTPEAVWRAYTARFQDINSLALSGSFSIFNQKTYECKLQLIYAAPDSFAFLAEGTLGVDLARGALVGGLGFWEIPRENYSEQLDPGDQIFLGEDETSIDINKLLNAIFFFRLNDSFIYEKQVDSRFVYTHSNYGHFYRLEISRDSAMPIRLTIIDPIDSLYVEYYDWSPISDNLVFPGRIRAFTPSTKITAEYHNKRAKKNLEIHGSFFSPKL